VRNIFRLIKIQWILMRYGIDAVILQTPWLYPWRFLAYLNPYNWFLKQQLPRGIRLRLALTALGPIFVKFGQLLSTRRDILPDDIADELALLQDQVPPFPGEQAVAIIEAIYQRPVIELFNSFDITPLASASIAQVHSATLLDNRPVVVKVLRPNIETTIRRDITLMYRLAHIIEIVWPKKGQRLRAREVVAEFEYCILNELDLLREAANASQLRRNFSGSNLLTVPEIYWPYARAQVLVMERIQGISISSIEALQQAGINFKRLAEKGVEIFFTQVFRDCFFHADMHPGNIFVANDTPDDPRYMAVDFGIMGSLSPHDQRYLAENLLAFFKRDYRRVAELHVESNWVSSDTRIDEFEAAIRSVCEPIFERPLKEISCAQMLMRLLQTAGRFNMTVQPQLLLLQKTLFNIEGLGRQLYPDLDLWLTAKPFLESWIKQQLGPRALWRKVRDNAPYWAERLPDLPDLIWEALRYSKQQRTIKYAPACNAKLSTRLHKRSFILGLLFAILVTAYALNPAVSANIYWLALILCLLLIIV